MSRYLLPEGCSAAKFGVATCLFPSCQCPRFPMPRTRKAKKLAHRSAPARALEKPEHRSRVIPNKKRSPSRNSKRARISKSLAEVLADTAVVIPAGSGESRIDIERPKLTRLIERSNRVGFD